MRRLTTRTFSLVAVVLVAVLAASVVRADTPEADSEDGSPALTASIEFEESLTGRVYVWDDGRLRPAADASVSTGSVVVRTDVTGRFEFEAEHRTGNLAIVQPGYDVVRRPIYFDQSVVVLRELVVRAIYVPFGEVGKASVQRYVHDLVDSGVINAVVVDIKDEAGRVYDIAATRTTDMIGASQDGTAVAEFLDELGAKGVYRIGRVVTFLDRWFSGWFPEHALKNLYGGLFIDGMGSSWSSAYSATARRYNVEIGAAAAEHVEEIQYDYVRLPYERNLLERGQYTEAERTGAITTFAREASELLHLAGVAVSFDTFGVISTAADDQGIGQSLEGVAQYLDYVSPMVYPSGWSAGSLGYAYPPAHPGPIVRINVEATIEKVAEHGNALVRPWLQDFHDYQSQGLLYLADQVHAQIAATAAAGGFGFMLWDPSMQYERQALERSLELTWSPFG